MDISSFLMVLCHVGQISIISKFKRNLIISLLGYSEQWLDDFIHYFILQRNMSHASRHVIFSENEVTRNFPFSVILWRREKCRNSCIVLSIMYKCNGREGFLWWNEKGLLDESRSYFVRVGNWWILEISVFSEWHIFSKFFLCCLFLRLNCLFYTRLVQF